MKLKSLLLTIVTLCCYLFSCKKDSNTIPTSEMKVRYELNWTGKLVQAISDTISLASANQLFYTNPTGNLQSDGLSGNINNYIKSVSISNSSNVSLIVSKVNLLLDQPATGELKIYANDKLVADQKVSSSSYFGIFSGKIAWGLVFNAHWAVQ